VTEPDPQPRSRPQRAVDRAEQESRRLGRVCNDADEDVQRARQRLESALAHQADCREEFIAWQTAIGTLRRAVPAPADGGDG
jgi:chromosome segregation ATPase